MRKCCILLFIIGTIISCKKELEQSPRKIAIENTILCLKSLKDLGNMSKKKDSILDLTMSDVHNNRISNSNKPNMKNAAAVSNKIVLLSKAYLSKIKSRQNMPENKGLKIFTVTSLYLNKIIALELNLQFFLNNFDKSSERQKNELKRNLQIPTKEVEDFYKDFNDVMNEYFTEKKFNAKTLDSIEKKAGY
jgi:hypothetical protein